MSVQKDETLEVTLHDGNGNAVTVSCSKQIVELLMCDDTDPQVKEMISSSLMHNKSSAETTADNVSKWTSEAEKLLLEKFSSTESGKPQRQKWKVVSNSLKEMGYNFSGEQCRLKVKSLKEKYERNKRKSLKSGESPPESDCDELQEVFDQCPDMKPVCVIDTSTDQATGSSTNSTAGEKVDVIPSTSTGNKKRATSVKDEPACADKTPKEKRPRRSVDVMKNFFGEVLQKREEAVERRHKEKMECVSALIGVLKESLNKK